MSVPFEPPEIARNVAAALETVAEKVGRADTMRHVCDFLGCPADAPYDDWVERFNKRRKDVRNAREGTADEEEKLVQLLGPFFKPNKARWRGLLNKMAQLDLQGDVESFARRAPKPQQIARRATDDAAFVTEMIGTPDADAVIRALYRECGLVVPEKPETAKPPPEKLSEEAQSIVEMYQQSLRDKARQETWQMQDPDERAREEAAEERRRFREMLEAQLHERETLNREQHRERYDPLRDIQQNQRFEPPRHQIPETPQHQRMPETQDQTQPSDPAQPEDEGLIPKLIDKIGGWLDQKVDDTLNPVDVSGQWHAPNGGIFEFQQFGPVVSAHGFGGNLRYQARGRISGSNLTMQGEVNGIPVQVQIMVSPDRRRMTGQIRSAYGDVEGVDLRR
ncbi:hypothetical protein SLH49_15580 [Cognatiyoonia sp. IB215446]|uniref:hypothetical protein n=1 Tax=Cognatiyoonia sp. IB215446 TaxID=3097355 RepID=UPI002A183462|nr:hypothetical protein [Cognatiyoonia sp. IB215446]MDX8349407.1 hypothetical protein [Cognatiyoonia sp. IB215446]